MPKRSDNPVSANRRGFFREIFISAVEVAETVSHNLVEKHLNRRFEPEFDPSDWYTAPEEVYGPAWPPPEGPPTPPEIQLELRQQRLDMGAHHDPCHHDPHHDGTFEEDDEDLAHIHGSDPEPSDDSDKG